MSARLGGKIWVADLVAVYPTEDAETPSRNIPKILRSLSKCHLSVFQNIRLYVVNLGLTLAIRAVDI
jgi:hypothetical protein